MMFPSLTDPVKPSLPIRCWIQMDSFTACVMAMYSDSVDDNATVGCFFDVQEIVPPPSVNTYPPTDFLSVPPPQFASVYPSNTNPSLPSKRMPRFVVSQRYLKMRLTSTEDSLSS